MKRWLKVAGLGVVFLTEFLIGNVRAESGINVTDYESRTQSLQSVPNQISPDPGQFQREEQVSSVGRGYSKIELTQCRDQLLEEIRQIEYKKINYDEESADYYGFTKGKIPILISAPHGAKHFRRRENRWRGEDEYTASMAIKLGQLTGAYVVYVKNKTKEDPNNDPASKYKMAVAKAVKRYHIKFLLDLHGSDENRPYKVDIGIISNDAAKGSCPTFKETIREVFSDFEPEIFNKKFCGNDACTMTFFARNELGIEAAQVEINAKYRIVERKPDSSKAKGGVEPHFRANEKDVLALMTRLKRTILEIDRKSRERYAGKAQLTSY